MNFNLILAALRGAVAQITLAISSSLSTLRNENASIENSLTGIEMEARMSTDALMALGSAFAAQSALLQEIHDAVFLPAQLAFVDVFVSVDGGITTQLTGEFKLQLKDTQQAIITFAPKDAKQQPSAIDPTKSTFTTDNPNAAILTPGADGLSLLVAAGVVGTAQITGSFTDANNPSDVVLITPISLTVIAGDTVTVDANVGTPTDQAPPAAPAS